MKPTAFTAGVKGGQSRSPESLATSADIFLAVLAFLAIGVLGGVVVWLGVTVGNWWAR